MILGGIGKLANLRGQGTWCGPVASSEGTWGDIHYQGNYHFEPGDEGKPPGSFPLSSLSNKAQGVFMISSLHSLNYSKNLIFDQTVSSVNSLFRSFKTSVARLSNSHFWLRWRISNKSSTLKCSSNRFNSSFVRTLIIA